jgi:hypothetical protein
LKLEASTRREWRSGLYAGFRHGKAREAPKRHGKATRRSEPETHWRPSGTARRAKHLIGTVRRAKHPSGTARRAKHLIDTVRRGIYAGFRHGKARQAPKRHGKERYCLAGGHTSACIPIGISEHGMEDG